MSTAHRRIGVIATTMFAVLSLAACQDQIAGQQGRTTGQTTGSASVQLPTGSATSHSVTAGTAAKTTARATTSAAGGADGGSDSGDSGSGGSDSDRAPRFVSATAVCTLDPSDTSAASFGTYHLIVSWELANATGMALSVDNPGIVGSYGTYGWHGTQDLSSLGCYADDRVQDIELYSVGGSGPTAHKVFHVHENHEKVPPPPFAGGTGPVTSTSTSAPTTTTTTTTTTPTTTTSTDTTTTS